MVASKGMTLVDVMAVSWDDSKVVVMVANWVVHSVVVKVERKVAWMDALMGEKWVGVTVDSKAVRLVDVKDEMKVAWMDGQMDASMVECLAFHWAGSTAEKMALLPVVRKDVNWVDRSVDAKDEMKVAWTEVLMVAS